jgi:hypothetical protein
LELGRECLSHCYLLTFAGYGRPPQHSSSTTAAVSISTTVVKDVVGRKFIDQAFPSLVDTAAKSSFDATTEERCFAGEVPLARATPVCGFSGEGACFVGTKTC